MANFFIQINEKGGKHFRRYTKESLQMLFDVSPTACNFELMLLIEGEVFLAYRTFCIISKCEEEYEAFIGNKYESTFSNAIEKIYQLGIIDDALKTKLNKYRELRNEIAHDLFRFKSLNSKSRIAFKDYSYTEMLEEMYKKGVEIIISLTELIIPDSKNPEYLKRFSGAYKRK